MPSEPRDSSSVATTMAEVLAVAALRVAAVLGRDGESEGPHLGQAGDDGLGDVAVLAVDVLGDGRDLALGEGPEGVLHELEVGVEVAGSGHRSQTGQERRIAVGGQEGHGLGQAVGGHVPQRLPAQHPAGQVVHRVGHEGARQPGLVVAQRAVAEHRARRLDGRGRVGQVVGQHLVGVGPAAGAEVADALAHHLLGQVDDGGGGLEVRGGHGARRYRAVVHAGPSAQGSSAVAPAAAPVRGGGGPDSRPMSRLCVFCGSNAGAAPAYADAAARLGSALASRGIGLVYGGGNVGLMGILADAVHRARRRGDRRDPRVPGAGRGRPHGPDRAARRGLHARAQGADGRPRRRLHRAARRLRHRWTSWPRR